MLQRVRRDHVEEAIPIGRDSAEHYIWGERCDAWRLLQNDSLSVIEECMPPGTAEARHYHNIAQQFFYILSGTANMEIENRDLILKVGQGISIAAGSPHRIRNISNEPVRFLVISQPSIRGDRVPA